MNNSADIMPIEGQNSKVHRRSSKIINKESLGLLPDGEIIVKNSLSQKNVSNYFY